MFPRDAGVDNGETEIEGRGGRDSLRSMDGLRIGDLMDVCDWHEARERALRRSTKGQGRAVEDEEGRSVSPKGVAGGRCLQRRRTLDGC
jgi:hypothetical protein